MNVNRPIKVRAVWADNLKAEMLLLGEIVQRYRLIAVDTEFPGTVVPRVRSQPYPSMKANVDKLKLIQIGLTLSDENGNLPDCGTNDCFYIWEFNFGDFDVTSDEQNAASIALLRRQGINFEMFKQRGIKSEKFAEVLMPSGLICDEEVTWIAFHSGDDFGYLVKILTQKDLPESLDLFLGLVEAYFKSVFDVKNMINATENVRGGLEDVCRELGVQRVFGNAHQAGSDSFMALGAFLRLKDLAFRDEDRLQRYKNVLHPLVSL